ncbi:lysylphosphatidylglycerol synthase transmembrane domain-containing protein [Haloarchaeobius amylolyticus]|uniref:lysylphosphatidylglycerol synthase transmembrane domain-containing protein n=1 Tax=Haloarchaeobius amylolyticus TaxID=1198296 RepID=UPI00226EFC95|nr:lysylphosphatidylglycerol synthase transmembrane domain-containing protein [Haloarchaeobius amylolyticus]
MAGDWDVRPIVAGFVGALVVLAVLLWFVGVEAVVAQLTAADPTVYAFVFLAALGWLLAWGLALRSVLRILGIEFSVRDAFLVYAAATFANNVTPFGQAGGEPFSALLISRVADSEYETGLAAIASVDAINFVPSVGFALMALGYYAVTVTLTDRLANAAVVVVLLTVVLAVAAYLAWQHRYRVEEAVVRVVSPLVCRVGRVVPRVNPPGPAAIRGRIEGFFATIERVASDRLSLLATLSYSAFGWLMLVVCLWLSLYALGFRGPDLFVAAMLAVPLGSVASVTPLPGGLGGIETVLLMVLPTVTGIEAASVSAAILLHRLATYWFPVFVGGSAMAALGASEQA